MAFPETKIVFGNEGRNISPRCSQPLRVDHAIPAEHEVGGLGEGSRAVDWVIGPVDGRRVLLDVKRRLADFIAAVGELSVDEAARLGMTSGFVPQRGIQMHAVRSR
jgi:hypothetical protein